MPQSSGESGHGLFLFYLPLALTAMMMNVSSTVINSFISKMPDALPELAAFAAAFAISSFTHSPVFAVQQIAIRQARSRRNTELMLLLFVVFSIFIIGLNLSLALTPLGDLLFGGLIGVSDQVIAIAKDCILGFIPLPFIILFRGTLQGLIINRKRTRMISVGTAMRLLLMFLAFYALMALNMRISAPLAALILSLGVLLETLILFPAASNIFKALPLAAEEDKNTRQMLSFAWPLILSMVLWTSSGFFISVIVGHSLQRDAALAITGIVYSSIGWLLASPTKPIMQMAMIYSGNSISMQRVQRFAAFLVLGLSGILFTLQFSPVNTYVFTQIFYLPLQLREVAIQAALIITFYPLFIAQRGFLQGYLIFFERTKPISMAAGVRVLILAAGAIVSMALNYRNGALIGVGILVGSILIENILLLNASKQNWRFALALPPGRKK
jgi:hypothetical protein